MPHRLFHLVAEAHEAASAAPLTLLDTDTLEHAHCALQAQHDDGAALQAGLHEADAVSATLQQHQAVLQQMQADGQELSTPEAQVLQTAVEHLCERLRLPRRRRPAVALEGFAQRAQRVQLALEGLGDVLKRIWDALVSAVGRALDWLKGFFKQLFGTQKKTEQRMEDLKKKAQDAEKEPQAEPPDAGTEGPSEAGSEPKGDSAMDMIRREAERRRQAKEKAQVEAKAARAGFTSVPIPVERYMELNRAFEVLKNEDDNYTLASLSQHYADYLKSHHTWVPNLKAHFQKIEQALGKIDNKNLNLDAVAALYETVFLDPAKLKGLFPGRLAGEEETRDEIQVKYQLPFGGYCFAYNFPRRAELGRDTEANYREDAHRAQSSRLYASRDLYGRWRETPLPQTVESEPPKAVEAFAQEILRAMDGQTQRQGEYERTLKILEQLRQTLEQVREGINVQSSAPSHNSPAYQQLGLISRLIMGVTRFFTDACAVHEKYRSEVERSLYLVGEIHLKYYKNPPAPSA